MKIKWSSSSSFQKEKGTNKTKLTERKKKKTLETTRTTKTTWSKPTIKKVIKSQYPSMLKQKKISEKKHIIKREIAQEVPGSEVWGAEEEEEAGPLELKLGGRWRRRAFGVKLKN